MNYMFMPLKRYADFSGRSRRLEFWLWTLFNWAVAGILTVIVMVAVFGSLADLANRAAAGEFANYIPNGYSSSSIELYGERYDIPPDVFFRTIVDSFGIPGILLMLYALATFIPNLAVAVRRLHDQDKSGWWILIALVPLIGGIWLLVLYFIEGTRGPNRFGPDPKAVGDAQVFS
ncbi:MAG TPA: DUF805 domain-containing protein [Allosphingosinicella sp.]|jgi:uncharacterized membrane protein YhaH (DUF805 family)|nr:DUF805 domain-containing protein [Allosphingosinicella sp.]